MEPLDPAKNVEGVFFKRRISSILKVPRKSIAEQQENKLEPEKVAEKRNSRRVSFAPADDVLLFANDAKDARNPLEELPTAAAPTTQNGWRVVAPGDENQPISGIENLLKSPLHAPQKDVVNFDSQNDFGEKTVIFTTNDATMDMTLSNTINITCNEELLDNLAMQSNDTPAGDDKKKVVNDRSTDVLRNHTVNMKGGPAPLPVGKSTDVCVEKRSILSNVSTWDEEFENFLSSIGKQSNTAVSASETLVSKSHAVIMKGGSAPVLVEKCTDASVEKKSVPSNVPTWDEKFENFLSSIGKQSGTALSTNATPYESSLKETCNFLSQNNAQTTDEFKENQIPNFHDTSKKVKESFQRRVLHPVDDVDMEMTEAQTAHIVTAGDDPFQCHFPPHVMNAYKDNGTSKITGSYRQSSETLASSDSKVGNSSMNAVLRAPPQRPKDNSVSKDECKENMTCRQQDFEHRSSNNKGVEASTKSFSKSQLKRQQLELEDDYSEKTLRFKGDDACMDVTQSHTVKISANLDMPTQQNVDPLPGSRDKTVRFNDDDACMDVTQSHTVNISTNLNMPTQQNVDPLPGSREKTIRFNGDDSCMDVTQSHTVNISTNLDMPTQQNVEILPGGREKTIRFNGDDACMDVTQSYTVNITNLNIQTQQNVDPLSGSRDKTVRFTTDDAFMDLTKCHTVNIMSELQSNSSNTKKPARLIATNIEPKSLHNVDFVSKFEEETVMFTMEDAAMDVTRCLTVNIASNSGSDLASPTMNFPPTVTNLNAPAALKKPDNETCVPHSNSSLSRCAKKEGLEHVVSGTEGHRAATALFCQDNDSKGFLFKRKTQKPNANAETRASGLVSPPVERSGNPMVTDGAESNQSMDMTDAQTGYILEQTHKDVSPPVLSCPESPKSSQNFQKEWSLQKQQVLQESKEIPSYCPWTNETQTLEEQVPTASLPLKVESSPRSVEQTNDASQIQKSRRKSLADLQSKVRRLSHIIKEAHDGVVGAQSNPCSALIQDSVETTSQPETEPELNTTNTKEKTQALALLHEQVFSATTPDFKTNKLIARLSVGGFKPKLPQRNNTEESKRLACVGEPTLTLTPVKETRQLDNDVSDIYDEELGSYEDMSDSLESKKSPDKNQRVRDVSEEVFVRTPNGHKRPLPPDENHQEDEKRQKTSTHTFELAHSSDPIGYDTNIATTQITQQTINSSSSSSTAGRSDSSFKSTMKTSLSESQFGYSGSDAQNKLEDGSITVSEFLKLFNIDFVIHNPRQSILHDRLLTDTDIGLLDLLKERHISLPKKLVYESDIKTLTEKVEGLKVRMRDLDKPLKAVNRKLWEDMRCCSEQEMKLFGAKLKERSNFFRKSSRVQSHEMKEVLYSNLVRASEEEQEKIKATIKEADGIVKSLDECINELTEELATVEEKGSEDKPSLKSLLEETKRVEESLADKERRKSELEILKMKNLDEINRLKVETGNLEIHMDALNMINEWKLKEHTDNYSRFSFLYDTMFLQLEFEKSQEKEMEQKITKIQFQLNLDEEKSKCHAKLVHKLVSQYVGETVWVEKYPTRWHVPPLLTEISLTVSHCRLLGDELRLLKMWGGLRLNIIKITCVDTRVHVVFSSLKKLSKFEVVFEVNLIDQNYVLHLESFKNKYGDITIKQIEEIMKLFTPGRKLLTKILKNIHDTLLSV